MACLCLVTVGVTDVQFPAWKQDEYGVWDGPFHFEIGARGCRAKHESLLALLRHGLIEFPNNIVRRIPRESAGAPTIDLEQEGDEFVASVTHPAGGYQIAADSPVIPARPQQRLPLYFPKMQQLLDVAIAEFGNHPYQTATVVVLNTSRSVESEGGRNEPIAAGPLTSAFLAERLSLKWVDNDGELPEVLMPGQSTWVNLLVEDENIEERAHQHEIVGRLNAILRAWSNNLDGGEVAGDDRVLVVTLGGMPLLKPITELVPATLLGEAHVRLLDQTRPGATASALNYREKWSERETLRFHCVEALRGGDYIGAYGLVGRFDAPWASKLRNLLGPLCDLPHTRSGLLYGGRPVKGHELFACQIETRLRANDLAGATVLLGVFMESAYWKLIAGDARLRELNLRVDLTDECLCGPWPEGEAVLQLLLHKNARGRNRHRVGDPLRRWPQWLVQPKGGQSASATVLDVLRVAYKGRRSNKAVAPQAFRNRLVHGARTPVDLRDLKDCLLTAGLIQGTGLPFGHNFFGVTAVDSFFTELGAPGIATAVGGQLDNLLDQVLGG